MRHGFTTGSCAAAAAKAAAYMLLSGNRKENITIMTPKGIPFHCEIKEIKRRENEVSCGVEKDGGDDPDITTGSLVMAKVVIMEQEADECNIFIDGGKGVGRVTRPGLDQPVGNAAINRVPREMIEKEVREVCESFDFEGELSVEIIVPDGEELAKKTFNPRLGIVGGISILGTTGIVEPMSQQAILDTIEVELRQHRAMGEKYIAIAPGNYGQEYMKQTYGYDLDKSVKCSNFIGATIDKAVELGFEKILLTGHIGKLVKVSGGIMNTHSKEGDCRMELLAASAVLEGVDIDTIAAVLDCVVTEEALHILEETEYFQNVMDHVMDRICYYLDKRAQEKVQIECIMYSKEFGELSSSEGAGELLKMIKENQ